MKNDEYNGVVFRKTKHNIMIDVIHKSPGLITTATCVLEYYMVRGKHFTGSKEKKFVSWH